MIEGNNVEIDAIIEDDSIVLETDLDYRGERGPVGETPDITIGKVDTLSPEDNAYVEKEGTKENITLNFGIPKGETGDIGPVGPTGPSGVYIGSDEPQDPEVDVWIDPTVNPENYVKEKELDDKLNSMIESGELTGPQGPQGIPGKDGIDGKDGVGITTITSGQSTVEDDKTVTPVTVNKTDGSSQIFNVEAKNGIDGKDGLNGKDGVNGQNGQDGITPTIGENGNWYLGDTDTGKPSRGEVGPTPDLSDYVKNTDYATIDKTGVIKARNYFRVSTTGETYVQSMPKEAYKDTNDTAFISKGTLENIKNDYVGSSQPVQDLTATVTNVQNDQDESMPKQTASGEMITVDDALAYKIFNVTVDGASEQVTTNGNQLVDFNNPYGKSTGVTSSFENNLLTVDGAAGAQYQSVFYNITDIVKANAGKVLKYKDKTHSITNENAISVAQIIVYHTDDTPTTYRVIYNYLTGNNNSYTIPSDVSNIRNTVFGIYTNNSSSTDIENTLAIEEPLLYLDDNDVYEPYTGGQPSPNPDYPQEITALAFDKITRCGKNLASRNYIGMNDSITFNNPFKSGEKITMVLKMPEKAENDNNQGINIFDSSDTMLFANRNTNWSMPESGWVSFVFSIVNDTNLLRLNAYGFQSNIEIPTAVLKGSLVEEGKYVQNGDLYEPYQGQTYDIDLQGNEMVELPNGVRNRFMVDKEGNVSLIKNIGKVILDGSEDWICTASKVYTLLADINLPWCDVADVPNFICDMFIPAANDSLYSRNNCISSYISTPQYNYQKLTISKYDFNGDVDLFKSFLSTHNVIVYYPLATPQTIPLGTLSELITTLNGTNNISINGNIPTTISTTYALDIKKYIDNKLAEISTAMIEEG